MMALADGHVITVWPRNRRRISWRPPFPETSEERLYKTRSHRTKNRQSPSCRVCIEWPSKSPISTHDKNQTAWQETETNSHWHGRRVRPQCDVSANWPLNDSDDDEERSGDDGGGTYEQLWRFLGCFDGVVGERLQVDFLSSHQSRHLLVHLTIVYAETAIQSECLSEITPA